QIDGLETAEGALDAGEALIGADHALGRQGFVLDAGADDIKAVEPGLLGDAEGTAGKGKAVFTDSDVEQLGEFVAVFGAADGARDPVFAHFDRHWAAIGRTPQTVDDLQFALLAVPRIAKARQLAAPAFEPGRGDVIENQRPVLEVAAGERGLDCGLARTEPVERA